MPRVVAVIPAGGVGRRFGARTPKQFLRLGPAPILAATVRHFARHPAVGVVVVAAPEPWVARARRILEPVVKDASLTVVAGGRTRQDSVWLALQAAPEDAEIVVVHDAVRPLITPALLQERVPLRDGTLALVERSRVAIADVLHGRDDRLVVRERPDEVVTRAIDYARTVRVIPAG